MERWERRRRLRRALLAALLAAGLTLPRPSARPAAALRRGAAEEKLAALTFDDGPGTESTLRLLEGLRERGVQATFFLIGRQVEERGDVVLRMAEQGHQIGIHTFDHVCVYGLSQDSFFEQTELAKRSVFRLLGEQELWFRPPYGLMDDNTVRWADEPLILWSVDPEDWRDADARRICRHIVDNTRDGDIILLHDIYDSSVDAALAAVDELQKRGFRFVTVRQLLYARGIDPAPGQVCRSAKT